MAQKETNIRGKRRNEGASKAFVYTVCAIIIIACLILDILFIRGIMP
ncbi:MAG: hypothetical protein J5685_12105 [Clostridiales bacterium]|nr:hypothetical protein [Clostridiales bacterium]